MRKRKKERGKIKPIEVGREQRESGDWREGRKGSSIERETSIGLESLVGVRFSVRGSNDGEKPVAGAKK